MCNPIAIAGLVAVAGGAAMQYSAAKDREKEMRGLQRRETERQDKLYDEAAVNLKKNQEAYDAPSFQQAMEAAAGERQAQYAKAEAAAPRANETLPGSTTSGNSVITDAFSRALEGATGQADQQGALRAELASFGDQSGTVARENNRRTGEIGMIGSFSKGSADVLPLELQHAATKERSKATWGSILQALGSAALTGGAGAGFGAAGAAAAPAAGSLAGFGNNMAGLMAVQGAAAPAAASSIPWASIFGGAAPAFAAGGR